MIISKETPKTPHNQVLEEKKPITPIKTINHRKRTPGYSKNIYVLTEWANLRESPTVRSPTIMKLKKGRKLTEIIREGRWVKVFVDESGGFSGWIHSSLIGNTDPVRVSHKNAQKAFNQFKNRFNLFATEIQNLKGVKFFEDIQYKGNGEIQVMVTDVLLSAPDHYQKKYLKTILEMWSEAYETTNSLKVVMVDKEGNPKLITKLVE